MLRLSPKEALVLGMLISGARERYGLELVELSKGQLRRGTIYVTLGRMEEKGLVSSRRESAGDATTIPRRQYRPTGLGRSVLRAHEQYAHSIGRIVPNPA